MLQKIWARLRTFCYYNRAERNGVLALLFALLILFSCLYLYERFSEKKNLDTEAFFAKVDSIEQLSQPEKNAPNYFSFNPNTADSSMLRALGFSPKQIRNLENYRKAGGTFRVKKDFAKLYFVNDSIYKVYEPYLSIPKSMKPTVAQNNKVTEKKENTKVQKVTDSLFLFNPNTISIAQWLQLGISERTATIIQNYLSKGGSFYKKEDLQKVYEFSQADYNRLAPYIAIPQKEKVMQAPTTIYDLNTITKEELEELHLSKSMAQKILNYREKLGGYAQMSQLLEVYNMNAYSLELLRKHCKIQSEVRQININTATTKDLLAHPYLNFREAEAIVRYRKRKGDYESVNVLQSRKLLTDKVFEKVRFYFKVKN